VPWFDIDAADDTVSDLPHMCPTVEGFERYCTELGIGNEDDIVVYDTQGNKAAAAPRVWWQFKYFGHEKIRLLSGDIPAVEGSYPQPPKPASPYKVLLNEAGLPMGHAFKTTRAAILERPAGTQLVDARSMGRFVGDVDEPWKNVYPDIKMGHIPGSRVLPHTDLGADETGAFLSLEALAELWRKAGVDLTKPVR
jgi:thiosulfate/3-mercaptopyruvate sulfurtransferase